MVNIKNTRHIYRKAANDNLITEVNMVYPIIVNFQTCMRKTWTNCQLSWTPGQGVHFLDNPGKIWTVGNYERADRCLPFLVFIMLPWQPIVNNICKYACTTVSFTAFSQHTNNDEYLINTYIKLINPQELLKRNCGN